MQLSDLAALVRTIEAPQVGPMLAALAARLENLVTIGLGVIYTDLAHLDPMVTTCETCDGKRFLPEVLEHRLRGKSIRDVYEMSADRRSTRSSARKRHHSPRSEARQRKGDARRQG
jgi:hypothetical protein